MIKSGEIKLHKGINIAKKLSPERPKFGVKTFYRRLKAIPLKRHAAIALLSENEMFGDVEVMAEK